VQSKQQGTDLPDLPDMVISPARLSPAEWQVQCPACEQWLPAEGVREQIDGSWAAEHEDQFIACACGVLVEVLPVQVTPA
jgi:hypothetical protein